jgi:vitamin B12 transporter
MSIFRLYPLRAPARRLLPALFLAGSAQAQISDPASLPAVVVTATRQEQLMDDLIANVTLISREQIERSTARTLGELLSEQAGIQMTRSGGPGTTEGIFIRGANSNHTLLLVDGVRVGSATAGTPSIDAITLSQIDRVEILRGGASSLYGSDAIGGVIQVFTKAGTAGTTLLVGAGTLGSRDLSFSHAGHRDQLAYGIVVAESASSGINTNTNSLGTNYNKDADGFRAKNASVYLNYKFNDAEIGYSLLASQVLSRFDSQSYDVNFNGPYNASADWKNTHDVISNNFWLKQKISNHWESSLTASRMTDKFKTTPSSIYPNEQDMFQTTGSQFGWKNDYASSIGKFLFGYDYLEQSISSTNTFDRTSRVNNSVYGGYTASFGKNAVQLNARHDDNSQFGGKTTNSVSYAYRPTEAYKIFASIGTSFKAPTFNDLYFPYIVGVGGGNPSLQPESALNREFGVAYQRAALTATVTGFRNNVSNLITWSDIGDGLTYVPSNVDSAKIEGVEFLTKYAFTQLEVGLNFTAQSATDAATGLHLPLRSNNYGTLYALYGDGDWKIRPELTGQTQIYSDTANTDAMGGFVLFNLSIEKTLDKKTTLFFKAKNIFDKDYLVSYSSSSFAPIRTPGMPATVMVGVRHQF